MVAGMSTAKTGAGTERPILFRSEMVRAILDGTKRQTRRVMKPQPQPCPDGGNWWPSSVVRSMVHVEQQLMGGDPSWGGLAASLCPFGNPKDGDRLWVRETFSHDHANVYPMYPIVYRADGYPADSDVRDHVPGCKGGEGGPPDFECLRCVNGVGFRWRPSIFMRRHDSRINLLVESVRVERLHQITDADAIAEGVGNVPETPPGFEPAWTPRDSFMALWKRINGADSWDVNPLVWVIGFKRIP